MSLAVRLATRDSRIRTVAALPIARSAALCGAAHYI